MVLYHAVSGQDALLLLRSFKQRLLTGLHMISNNGTCVVGRLPANCMQQGDTVIRVTPKHDAVCSQSSCNAGC